MGGSWILNGKTMSLSDIQQRILTFWFGEPSSPDYESFKSYWFQSTPKLDQQIRNQFEEAYNDALKGKLDSLAETSEGSLALILLLDQFPRNMYRGTPQAFLSDPQALRIAKEAISKGQDTTLPFVQKMFLYMPFQHSESLADQERSLELFKSLADVNSLAYAQEHYDLIKRFGRFPHRNKILGRANLSEETMHLSSEQSQSFGQ